MISIGAIFLFRWTLRSSCELRLRSSANFSTLCNHCHVLVLNPRDVNGSGPTLAKSAVAETRRVGSLMRAKASARTAVLSDTHMLIQMRISYETDPVISCRFETIHYLAVTPKC